MGNIGSLTLKCDADAIYFVVQKLLTLFKFEYGNGKKTNSI